MSHRQSKKCYSYKDQGGSQGRWREVVSDEGYCNASSNKNKIVHSYSNGWLEFFPMLNIPNMFNYGHIYNYIVESICDYSTKTEDRDDSSSGDSEGDGYTNTAKPLRKGTMLMKIESYQFLYHHEYVSMNCKDV